MTFFLLIIALLIYSIIRKSINSGTYDNSDNFTENPPNAFDSSGIDFSKEFGSDPYFYDTSYCSLNSSYDEYE